MKKVLTVMSLFLFMAFLGGAISVTMFEKTYAGEAPYCEDCLSCNGTCSNPNPLVAIMSCCDDGEYWGCTGGTPYPVFNHGTCSVGGTACGCFFVGCWDGAECP